MNKTIHRLMLLSGLLCASSGVPVFANTIRSVSIEPTFECAGIIATLSGTDDPGRVTLEVKGPGEANYRPAHDLIRYDNYHMATSLFNLQPGERYDVRLTLGAQVVQDYFTTRPEGPLPPPMRTVPVANSTELLAALANAQAGDEILLSPGTYSGGLNIAGSGTPEHPIVIRGKIPAAEKTKPVDRRTGLPVIDGSGRSTVITVSGSHVVLDSVRVQNVTLQGIRLESTKYGIVQGCQVVGTSSGWNHFIYVNGGGPDGGRHLIQDNYLSDSGTGAGYGIYQNLNPGPGTVIRRNILTGFYDGINPSGNEHELNDANVPETHPDILARWPNHSTDVYENVIRISRDDDIEMDGIAVNARVFRNYLSVGAGNHCTNAITIAPVAPGPFFFVRNVITNFYEGAVKYNTASNRGTIRNCYFYHNTIINDEGTARRGTLLTLWDGTGEPWTTSKNTYYKNNIFAGDQMLIQRLVPAHTPAYNPNLWYSKRTQGTLYQWGAGGPYYSTFDAWRNATGQEAQGLYGAPMVDASFRPLAGSPAVDRGIPLPGINDTYYGSAPDMGAYEYGTPAVPGPNPPMPFPEAAVYSISGYARDMASMPISDAAVTLSGAASLTAKTDGNGYFRFTGLGTGDYTVTIRKTGYYFTPASKTLSVSSSDNALDFSGTANGEAETLENAYAFPNPWQAGQSPSPHVTFKGITRGTRISVFTLAADFVTELHARESSEIRWDVSGDIASGVYFCVLTNEKGQKKKLKIAVIK